MQDRFISGTQPILEAMDQDVAIEKFWIRRDLKGDMETTVRRFCKDHNIPLSYVPDAKLSKLVRSHQGVIALAAQIEYWDVDAWIEDLLETENGIAVALDSITDIRNIGAICRSAEVFGAVHILLPMKNSGILNADAAKTSAGAIEHLKVCRTSNFLQTLLKLKDQELPILGADMEGKTIATWADGQNQKSPIVLVMGSEEKGINPNVKKIIKDDIVSIKQYGKIDSLNVSVAAGILLSQLRAHLEKN